MGKKGNAYRILVGRPGRQLRRPGRRCNIKMDLREIVWRGMNCIHLAQDRDLWRALVNMEMDLQVS
jgi:hypothetical protein